jgi:terminase small subunit-like protein
MKPKLQRTGRHTLKTPELCNEICERVAKGETLTDICRDAAMPDWSTVHRWAARCDAFRNDLARAREQQAEVWADELVDISDAELPTRQAIRRARLRMQSRQWLAGKYNSRFADKPNQTQVSVGVGIVITEAERVKLLERHQRAMLANQGDKSGESAPTPPEP